MNDKTPTEAAPAPLLQAPQMQGMQDSGNVHLIAPAERAKSLQPLLDAPSRHREDLELWDRCYDRQKQGMPFLDCVSLFADAIRAQAKTALDYFAEDVEASCDTCRGSGQVCVGSSGRDDDGNAPVMERCPECGHGESAPPGSIDEMLEWIESMTDDAPIRNMAQAARVKLTAALGSPARQEADGGSHGNS